MPETVAVPPTSGPAATVRRQDHTGPSERGLSSGETARRLHGYGENAIVEHRVNRLIRPLGQGAGLELGVAEVRAAHHLDLQREPRRISDPALWPARRLQLPTPLALAPLPLWRSSPCPR